MVYDGSNYFEKEKSNPTKAGEWKTKSTLFTIELVTYTPMHKYLFPHREKGTKRKYEIYAQGISGTFDIPLSIHQLPQHICIQKDIEIYRKKLNFYCLKAIK